MNQRKKIVYHNYGKLILNAALVGLLSSLLAVSLKFITDFFEHQLIHTAFSTSTYLFLFYHSLVFSSSIFYVLVFLKTKRIKGLPRFTKRWMIEKNICLFIKFPRII